MTVTVNDQENATGTAQLSAAAENRVAAEVAYLVALSPDGPLSSEYLNLAAAQLNHDRALLAAQLAAGVVLPGARRVVSIACQSGCDWIPMRWGAFDARYGETASTQALRHAVENNLPSSAHVWRVLVWTDPRPQAQHDGEWTNAVDAQTPAPVVIVHQGVALNSDGASLYNLFGTLHYDHTADESGDGQPIGAWVCQGVLEDFEIPEHDLTAAQRAAADALANYGKPKVVGWQQHRDRFGTLWTPVYAQPAPDPLPADTRAMPNGTELPGEHWNARLIREERERANGEPPSAQPVVHLTMALDGDGKSLRLRDSALLFDPYVAEVGAWSCNGVGYDTSVRADDHLAARRWAVRKLAERGRTVIGWRMHRDSLGTFWLPTIAGRQS